MGPSRLAETTDNIKYEEERKRESRGQYLDQPNSGVLFGAGQVQVPTLGHGSVARGGVRPRAAASGAGERPEPGASRGGRPPGKCRRPRARKLGTPGKRNTPPAARNCACALPPSLRRAGADKLPASAAVGEWAWLPVPTASE